MRYEWTFLGLVVAQAAHSFEEYVGHLWEVFAPARLLSGLVSGDPETGFVIINATLVAFGIWCLLWPVRRRWPSAEAVAWFWVVLELVNGIGHSVWSVSRSAYTPGLATAPVLFLLAVYLAYQLATRSSSVEVA